jgi:hypothetical protein
MFGIFRSNQKLADEIAKTEEVLSQKLNTGLDEKTDKAIALFKQAQAEAIDVIEKKKENISMIDAHMSNLQAFKQETATEIVELTNFSENIEKIFKTKL